MNLSFLTTALQTLSLEPENDTVYVLPRAGESLDITLSLNQANIKVIVFGLFSVSQKTKLTIVQNHQAPQTESHVLVRALIKSEGDFEYNGNLHIEKDVLNTIASQEIRGLLLSDEARFKAIPSLEILPQEVVCSHKASSAPVSKEALYLLQSRGFSVPDAQAILEKGFLEQGYETLSDWGALESQIDEIKEYYA